MVPSGGSINLLVVYDFAGTASPGNTFQARIGRGGITAENASDGSSLTVGGIPAVAGGFVTIVASGGPGSLTILNGED